MDGGITHYNKINHLVCRNAHLINQVCNHLVQGFYQPGLKSFALGFSLIGICDSADNILAISNLGIHRTDFGFGMA